MAPYLVLPGLSTTRWLWVKTILKWKPVQVLVEVRCRFNFTKNYVKTGTENSLKMHPFTLSTCRLPEKIIHRNKNDRWLLTSALFFVYLPCHKNNATASKKAILQTIYYQITVYMATFRLRIVNSTVVNATRGFTNKFNSWLIINICEFATL